MSILWYCLYDQKWFIKCANNNHEIAHNEYISFCSLKQKRVFKVSAQIKIEGYVVMVNLVSGLFLISF